MVMRVKEYIKTDGTFYLNLSSVREKLKNKD